jgi:hypothetical protein
VLAAQIPQSGLSFVRVTIPALTPDWRTVYVKAMNRKVWAFALAGVALAAGADPLADNRQKSGARGPLLGRALESV